MLTESREMFAAGLVESPYVCENSWIADLVRQEIADPCPTEVTFGPRGAVFGWRR